MRRLIQLGLMSSLLLLATGLAPFSTQAKSSAPQPARVSSAYDLIEAVNNLRASYDLPPYQVNPILMSIAQAHAEYMAATGSVTHYSADGSRPSQRALAAGYPASGWFSENIIAGLNLSAQAAVDAWMSDAPHQNTMLSSIYREVGAGVATAGDKVYYTLDAGLATGSPPAAYTPGATGLPKIPVVSTGTLIPNTPNADGSIIHVVRKGDTIYGIAFAYGIPVEELLRLNGLTLDTVLYVGKQLIIRPV
ncbi:MAG: CAP domain-containing protein, partial [Anaerolineales bacterium]|nr:CAP domain-containing protein [Anaerolineales bacterium]